MSVAIQIETVSEYATLQTALNMFKRQVERDISSGTVPEYLSRPVTDSIATLEVKVANVMVEAASREDKGGLSL